MTVGVPEINLDTWGLKYVKKKSPTQNVDTSTTETERRGVGAHSNFQSGKPSENITTRGQISDADVKTPSAIETRQEGSESGTVRTTGATEGSDKKRQQSHGKEVPVGSDTGIEIGARKKLTPQGKPSDTKNVQNPAAVAAGREASHESGIRSVEARSGKDRVGGKVNPEKVKPTPRGAKTTREAGDKPKGTTGTVAATDKPALPKVKAEMELAIIKCKLLKMNDISKRGEWDHLPHAQKEKEEEEKVEKGTKDYGSDNSGSAQIPDTGDGKPTSDKQSVKDPPTSPSKYRKDESEVTSYGEGASGNQHGGKTTHGEAGDKQLNVEGKIGRDVGNEDIKSRASTKSDEIVGKAIELINEAYDEMKSTDFRKLKPTYEGDTKEAKKEGADGGTSTTSSEGGFNHVYSDVHEAKRQKQNQ